MGFNTSMLIMNDALTDIKNDPAFGRKVSEAVSELSLPVEYRSPHGVDISSGGHCNAAIAIESHHADYNSVIAFGENYGTILSKGLFIPDLGKDEPKEVKYLRALASQLGYSLRKKT